MDFICLILGLVVAYLVTNDMKKKLNSVSAQSSAIYYIDQGSLNITTSKELFLGAHTTRTKVNSGNHSGGGHRGGGHRGGGHRGGGGRGRR